jgi:hypothetical protein
LKFFQMLTSLTYKVGDQFHQCNWSGLGAHLVSSVRNTPPQIQFVKNISLLKLTSWCN